MRVLKCVKEFIRQGLEKRTRDGESAFCQTNRTGMNRGFRQGRDLRDGVIPLTQQNPFSGLQFRQVFGEMRLRFMNVQFNHDLTLN